MPTLTRAPLEIQAQHMAGKYITHAEKNLKPQDVFRGQNWRQNKDGGRYPRPGFEDSLIDYSSYGFTVGRGMLSAKTPPRLWLAGDDGSEVKLTYVETDQNAAQYGVVLDVGVSLEPGYRVFMKEWQGNIFYANGFDTVSEVIVGQVAAGGVLAAATELDLKGGRGVFFPVSGSGEIGGDTFTWSGKTSDQLTGVSGLASNHSADELVTSIDALSPDYEDKAAFLEEWYSSLNLFGDPDQPFIWEFSKFANAGAPDDFKEFGGDLEPEIVGQGGKITAALATKNFFYVWKEDSLYATGRDEVDVETGARPPQPIEGASGTVGPFSVTQAGKGGDAYYQTTTTHFVRLGIQVENGSATTRIDDEFDSDLDGIRGQIDQPTIDNWSHYNPYENLLKFSAFESGVRVVFVWDFNVGTFYRDTNKNYDCVTLHGRKTWGFDGSAGKMYIDEVGNFDDDVPVEMEWETGRLGRDEFQLAKARYIHMHGYMTQGSINYVDFYKDGMFLFTTILDDSFIISLEDENSIQVGTQGIGSGSSVGSGGSPPKAFPFRLPIGAYHRGEDFKIKVRSLGENGEFVQFDGYTIGLSPLTRSPYRHV
jgi:hypothetical protein